MNSNTFAQDAGKRYKIKKLKLYDDCSGTM